MSFSLIGMFVFAFLNVFPTKFPSINVATRLRNKLRLASHPAAWLWSTVVVAIIIGAIATQYAAAPVVRLVGFGPSGPINGLLCILSPRLINITDRSIGTWAASIQRKIGNVREGSPFAVAQRVGMGGPVPWYGTLLGGIILGFFILVAYIGVMCCCLTNNSSRLTRGSGDDIEYRFSFSYMFIQLIVSPATRILGSALVLTPLLDLPLAFLLSHAFCTIHTCCKTSSLTAIPSKG
jgi:hypothetical protein